MVLCPRFTRSCDDTHNRLCGLSKSRPYLLNFAIVLSKLSSLLARSGKIPANSFLFDLTPEQTHPVAV